MPNIKIYTTPVCTYCRVAKEFFKQNNFSYEEVDVTVDDAALDEMVNKSHQMAVPVITIDNEVFVGFDRKGISETLRIA